MAENRLQTPFATPFYMIAKPVGAQCNLRCEYCYYLEKSKLYVGRGQQVRLMPDDVLQRFIQCYIEAQTMQDVLFCWHGGEAMMRPLSFFQRIVDLQNKYRGCHVICNTIQTNGTLLTDEWCRFLKDNGWIVGLSIDGPEEFHDAYRRFKGGDPTFARVMEGIELLNKHGVEWNALAVVNDINSKHPREFYDFFKSIGCRYIQFTPVVERLMRHDDDTLLVSPSETTAVPMAPFSVTPHDWGEFLCGVFDEWVRNDVGEYFVQLFDATLANWVGVEPGLCTMATTCGHAGAIEFNGDVYSCDHFVFPEYLLGNISRHNLVELMYSDRQRAFGRAKRDSLPAQCRRCGFLFACNGECPKNRFAFTADGEPGLNYLCEGYRRFFSHAAPYMDFMRRELSCQRPPSNVMFERF